MKYTLKNRPKRSDKKYWLPAIDSWGKVFNMPLFLNDTISWFVGFQNQEKKKELYLRTMPEASIQHLRDKVRAYERHLKEILGE